MVSAKILVLLLVGTVVGALVGLALGDIISRPLLLAILSGSVATVVASVIRNFKVSLGTLGPEYSPLPYEVVVFAVIASVIASAGAVKLDEAAGLTSPIWIGATAGLLSAILLALLSVTYLTGRKSA